MQEAVNRIVYSTISALIHVGSHLVFWNSPNKSLQARPAQWHLCKTASVCKTVLNFVSFSAFLKVHNSTQWPTVVEPGFYPGFSLSSFFPPATSHTTDVHVTRLRTPRDRSAPLMVIASLEDLSLEPLWDPGVWGGPPINLCPGLAFLPWSKSCSQLKRKRIAARLQQREFDSSHWFC